MCSLLDADLGTQVFLLTFQADVITGVLALSFDTFTFVATLVKTYQHFIEMRRLGLRGITQLIIRDGKLLNLAFKTIH